MARAHKDWPRTGACPRPRGQRAPPLTLVPSPARLGSAPLPPGGLLPSCSNTAAASLLGAGLVKPKGGDDTVGESGGGTRLAPTRLNGLLDWDSSNYPGETFLPPAGRFRLVWGEGAAGRQRVGTLAQVLPVTGGGGPLPHPTPCKLASKALATRLPGA